MCALCGILGAPAHWTDEAARPGVFTPNTDPLARRRERARRVRLAGRILRAYGLSISDWQGVSYVLSSATGKTELVADFGHLWPAAERLSGRSCDPLSPDLLRHLQPHG